MISKVFSKLTNEFSVRLILMFVVLTVGSSLALNYYFFGSARQELKKGLIHRGQGLTRMLADMSRIGVFIGSQQDLQIPASIVFREPGCKKVFIYDLKGELLLSLGDERNSNNEKFSSGNLYTQVAAGSSDEPVIIDKPRDSEIVFGKAILSNLSLTEEDLFFSPVAAKTTAQTATDLQPIGYVVVILSTRNLEAEARNFMLQNLAVSVGVVLASSLCIFFVVRNMTRPLKSLAREIKKHKFTGDDGGNTEAQDNFTEMIDIIQESYREISALKENLEQKVGERTAELSESNTALEQQTKSLESMNVQLNDTLEELQCTQSQLVQSEKMAALGLLLGGLSHEINNALNFISGAMPLLDHNLQTMGTQIESGTPTPEEQERQKRQEQNITLLGNIKEGVSRISELAHNLRVFGYTNQDKFSREDIYPGLAACIGILRSRYGKQIDIKEEIAGDLPRISCNIGQLNQVFMNLLLNAAQSIQAEGTIVVKTFCDDKELHVIVSDTGEGIPAASICKVFDPYYTTKKMGEGTGLGLSISYSIISSHGGKIDVSSKPGEGSTVDVALPI